MDDGFIASDHEQPTSLLKEHVFLNGLMFNFREESKLLHWLDGDCGVLKCLA